MNPMLIGLLAGAGLGLLKNNEDTKAYNEAKKESNRMNAVKARFMPWTGVAPRDFTAQKPSMTGALMQGAMAGGMFGQQFDGEAASGPAADPATQNLYVQQGVVDPYYAGYTPPPSAAVGGRFGRV